MRQGSWPLPAIGVFVLGAAIVWAVCGLYYCTVPASPDQFIFEYLGFLATKGMTFYSGGFDISWPGPLLYHELGIRLFGVHGWTARLQDFCLLPIGMAGLWLIARRAGFAAAGWGLILLYPIVYVTSGGWMAGHRDIVAMHMLLLATGLIVGQAPHRGWARIAVGAIVGFVTFVRPTYLFVALPFWLIELARERRAAGRLGATGQFALGLGLVILAFAIAGIAKGSIADWYEQAVVFPATAYQVPEGRGRLIGLLFATIREQFFWPSLVAISAAPLWVWRRIAPQRDGWAPVYILSLVVTVLVSYFVQNKGFGYQLGGLIPLFMLSAALGIEGGVRALASKDRASGARWLVYPALGLAVSLLGVGIAARIQHSILPAMRTIARSDGSSIGRSGTPERTEAARIVAQESGVDDLVLQWGWNYEVPYLAQRKTATRYVNNNLLAQIRPVDVRMMPWLDRFRREMTRDRVAFIVVDTNVLPRSAFLDGIRIDPAMPGSTRIVLALISRGYRPIYDRGDIVILKRI